VLRTAVAFFFAPLAGAVVGGIVLAVVMPGNVGLLILMYIGAGSFIALSASLVVGVPTLLLLRRTGAPLLPWLLVVAVPSGWLCAVAVQCLLRGCATGPWHGIVFALTTAAATAVVLSALLPSNRAL
jgi:hypothetical protein